VSGSETFGSEWTGWVDYDVVSPLAVVLDRVRMGDRVYVEGGMRLKEVG
jgi:hypothetical protein